MTRDLLKRIILMWSVVIQVLCDSQPFTYVLNLHQKAWLEGKDSCEQDGGIMAKLYDISTVPDMWISESLTRFDGLIWTGLRRDEAGSWAWSDGSEVSWRNWDLVYAQNENCVAVSVVFPHLWQAVDCHRRLPYLCQFNRGSCRFLEFDNKSISVHNYLYLYGKSPEECKTACETDTQYECQSFEYHTLGRRCQFNSGNMWSLHQYFQNHSGWTYYHRTCVSGEVRGTPLPIEPSITVETSSSTALELSTSSEVLLTSTPIIEDTTSLSEIDLSTSVIEESSKVRSCVVVTETITLYEMSFTSIAPSTSVVEMSSSVIADPVDELVMEETLKERRKQMKRVSADDKRPSAKYVGCVAVAFLCCVFGSIVIFDLLTICRHTGSSKNKNSFWRWGKVLEVTKRKSNAKCSRRSSLAANATSALTNAPSSPSATSIRGGFQMDGERLWRTRQWSLGDSGIADRDSESQNDSDLLSTNDDIFPRESDFLPDTEWNIRADN